MNRKRAVGSINYELKIRSARQLASSRSHIEAKLQDLVKLKPSGEFRKHYKNADKISEIVQVWQKSLQNFILHDLSAKKTQLFVTNQRRISDLNILNTVMFSFFDSIVMVTS